jgi:hypothetical protein
MRHGRPEFKATGQILIGSQAVLESHPLHLGRNVWQPKPKIAPKKEPLFIDTPRCFRCVNWTLLLRHRTAQPQLADRSLRHLGGNSDF